MTTRCEAAHPEDPTPCDGGPADAVLILDRQNAGAGGCEWHGARLLASMEGARAVSGPHSPGAAIRVTKAADGIRPFPWYENAPRTEPGQLSAAENRGEPAGPNPVTGEGFDAPLPADAYKNAPEMLRESASLLQLSTRLTVAVASGEPQDEDQQRLYLLRRAALADRMSLEYPHEHGFLDEAVETSQTLIAFDREHPHLVPAGIHGPNSPEWDPSARPYVRACYDAWGWA